MIGSAFIIEAKDMEDAIRIASLHPSAQLDVGEKFRWGIEIRPILLREGRRQGLSGV